MDVVGDLVTLYLRYLRDFALLLVDPSERLFGLYLVGGLAFALALYFTGTRFSSVREQDQPESKGFLRFLFPRHVWSNPSAWLDVRYFFFHKLLGHALLMGVTVAATAWGYALVTGGSSLGRDVTDELSGWNSATAVIYVFYLFMISDLVAYWIHRVQHTSPLLWEFHRVHHSAEVMHPLSNYREHPVDNLLYKLIIGAANGLSLGAIAVVLGYQPTAPLVIGVPLLAFAFNLMGYHLRHSHLWLRWPGVWSKVLPSSAHHHVHHSSHPDHIDKNFAFMFPMWDVVFGSYELPETNQDVAFGVHGYEHSEMDTCLKLYTVPFKRATRVLRSRKAKATAEDVVTASDTRPTVTT